MSGQAGRWIWDSPRPVHPVTAGPRPSFSVIVPAYNAAAFIGEAVRSALAQTSQPLEVIVADDGSEDGLEHLAGLGDRVVVLRLPHRGVAAARNEAVRAASGDFVAMLDSDDVYLPERLEALGALAAVRPDLDIVCSDAFVEAGGAVRGRFHADTPFAVEDQRGAILERCFCPWPAIRRDRLLAIGGFDESLRTGSDWECVIRLILAGCSAGVVVEPLYRYRLRSGSLTARRLDKLRDRVQFLEATRAHPGLRPPELRALARSLANQRRSLLVAEAHAALQEGRPDARRCALRVVAARRVPLRRRLQALFSALAPAAAAGMLERRAAPGR
jgi:Glycosyl transferase family 2